MAEAITPTFKDQEEKNIVMAAIGISILLGLTGYLGIVAPLVVYFGMQNKLSSVGREIIRRFSNFQILLCIVCVILTITGVGILIVPLIGIYGLIIALIALLAIMNNEPVNIPVFVEIIKETAGTTIPSQEKTEQPKDELKP